MNQSDLLRQLLFADVTYVIGMDEAGAGAWAGPLVVGGVVVKKGWAGNVKDSKRYSNTTASTAHEKRIKAINVEVKPFVEQWYISRISASRIDEVGLGVAKMEAFQETASKLQMFFTDSITVIDGNQGFGVAGNVLCIPKADDLVPVVSAASLFAKTTRDGDMFEQHKATPQYGFNSHVGYGTPEHLAKLEMYGAMHGCHRMSFKPVAEVERGRSQSSEQSGEGRQAG